MFESTEIKLHILLLEDEGKWNLKLLLSFSRSEMPHLTYNFNRKQNKTKTFIVLKPQKESLYSPTLPLLTLHTSIDPF